MKISAGRVLSIGAASIGAIALVLVSSTSSLAQAPDVFAVTSLTTDNAIAIDANATAGDDDGFMGVTGSKFVFSGDVATVAYDLADLGNPHVTDVNNATQQNNWLFSDLKTQTSYLFDADQPTFGELVFSISGIQPLDQAGDLSGPVIPLSEVVTIDNQPDTCTMFASGYGRVAIWDACVGVVYDIALPSGVVTTLTGVATFGDYSGGNSSLNTSWFETENGVFQIGVVEYDGSALHILALARDASRSIRTGIYRYNIQSPADEPTEVLSFGTNDPDIWEFTVSPATNQWCSGAEDGWYPVAPNIGGELAFCASATFSTPAAAPALANTGVDGSGYLVGGAAVLLAGAAMVLVARRRTARR